ncbi:MAG: pyridoxal phosphate-dependent aminotransferase [Desulfatiglandales bacterium]
MAPAIKMQEFLERASWIRKMFEEGARRKKLYGVENVYDFSLGNPNLDPPQRFREVLKDLAGNPRPSQHAYMPNAGLPRTRQAVADYLSREHGLRFGMEDIVMTCGAGGALNVIFKALLNPGEKVIFPAPYFVEYNFYVDNHGGIPVSVETDEGFLLDLREIEAAIDHNTKAVLINSPNNPTGRVYPEEQILLLGELLRSKSKEFGTTIYLVADEPYRKLVYDDISVPSIFRSYQNTILATSFSKDLSIPGERIGYIAISPESEFRETLSATLVLANRILGFVNAPAFMQWVLPDLLDESVDVNVYKRKRDMLAHALKGFGYELHIPEGAFYLFPKSPIEDDVKFVGLLQEENILVVPGSGFGRPGYFRIAYCVDDRTIEGSLPGFKRVIEGIR